MFMNIAATNTTLTLTLGLMCMRGTGWFLGDAGGTIRGITMQTKSSAFQH
jgi:hypothetical protein